MSAGSAPVSAGGVVQAGHNLLLLIRRAGSSTRLIGPVLAVALGLAVIVGPRLAVSHGNPTGLIQFGRQFARYTHPPRGAIIGSPIGYDGQFYWIQARDPLLLHRATLADIDASGRRYDLQRMAYPALAALLAAGQVEALPWTLLLVNVMALLAVTAAVAAYARSRGRSVWWALAVGLTPGMVMGTVRDLSDPLATAAMIGGLIAYERGRRWPAAVLLALAALAREPMFVAVAAVGIDLLAALWRGRRSAGDRRRVLRFWPAVVLPVVMFVAWQAYTRSLTVPPAPAPAPAGAVAAPGPAARAPAGSDTALLPPLRDFDIEIRRAVNSPPVSAAVWDLVYIALVLAGMVAAVLALRRGPWATTVTAVLTAAVLTVVSFGDEWGVARYGAPLFGTLLLVGLRARVRAVPRLCAAAAVLTVVVPMVIAGG